MSCLVSVSHNICWSKFGVEWWFRCMSRVKAWWIVFSWSHVWKRLKFLVSSWADWGFWTLSVSNHSFSIPLQLKQQNHLHCKHRVLPKSDLSVPTYLGTWVPWISAALTQTKTLLKLTNSSRSAIWWSDKQVTCLTLSNCGWTNDHNYDPRI